MSHDAVAKFFERVEADGHLGDRLRALGDGKDPDAAGAEIVALAAEAGFEFTVAELDREIERRARGQLSEEQLESVAGGGWFLPEVDDEVLVTFLRARRKRIPGDGVDQDNA